MMGLVSGVHARPQRPVHERYIQLPMGEEIRFNPGRKTRKNHMEE
jgi:hypothetical protein